MIIDELEIVQNGEYELIPSKQINQNTGELYAEGTHNATIIQFIENSANATVEVGLRSKNGQFSGYPEGVIPFGKQIKHGVGITLMVKITGMTSGTITLNYSVFR